MHDFLLKELSNTNIEHELKLIGFDESYVKKAAEKFIYKNYKIYGLTCAQANILKQTALATGSDCATNKNVITGKAELSDCILTGSISQLKKIAQKLQYQPFELKNSGIILEEKLNNSAQATTTKIIGILNLTTDSFSDGGQYYDFDDAVKHLNDLIKDGADIIDIGAESTKPFSTPVDDDKQLEKLLPILDYIKNNGIEIPVSIDTRSAEVAKECIKKGAAIINDVSGLEYDSEMVNVISSNPEVKIIIQHSQGMPDVMQVSPEYENLTDDIFKSLKEKTDFAISKGIKKENIILDAGIGFGKTKEHNLEIIRRWKELKTIGCPILLGLSRKSFLDIPQADNSEKDLYTLAFNGILMNENIDYIRVHNVKIHKNFQNILHQK